MIGKLSEQFRYSENKQGGFSVYVKIGDLQLSDEFGKIEDTQTNTLHKDLPAICKSLLRNFLSLQSARRELASVDVPPLLENPKQ